MKALASLLLILVAAFLIWPYTAVYRLDKALEKHHRQALDEMVDIQSVRDQIKRKLNKNLESSIGDVSNSFIDWLQGGIQQLGANAIDEMVNTNWVASQLRSHNRNPNDGGFVDQLTYAFFDGPDRMLLRIGELDENPVHAHLKLQGTQWRITAVYN
ncbi:MAG: DUF2939 domain-containing protein [Candidatus Thiodiazotropha sp. (ex Semelilucina semeliformis)]|nr:DUF2939 domain-containing protein [Candidatus Thiodiazotropha sp. (ex Myrtea spinifera)]MCU7808989.1 DUF2939 domain-containing protein [Candidatus Thiodiazotropha sp. (ex Semelilucina semeliformis)]MCU7828687.1 DUF2939 domain-containing protein [Candidatus Thiodiazotropha sp. (ex Myrtea sp. 'scaly one' KF741663)]